MKLKFLTAVLVLTTIISCNQTQKYDGNLINVRDTIKQEPIRDTAMMGEQRPGVFFVNIKDGDKLKSPVIIQMGVTGMTVEHAGLVNEGRGHHHLIVDGSFIEKGKMVPQDATHFHFGKGQTSDTLKLNPGKHSLTLQFANGAHESYGKDWSKTIAITVVN